MACLGMKVGTKNVSWYAHCIALAVCNIINMQSHLEIFCEMFRIKSLVQYLVGNNSDHNLIVIIMCKITRDRYYVG